MFIGQQSLVCLVNCYRHLLKFDITFKRLLKLFYSGIEGNLSHGYGRWKFLPNIDFKVPYSQQYLFNAIPDTNHNANHTNPNHYSKGNPNPTNLTDLTNPNTRYQLWIWHPKLNVCQVFFL